MAETDRPTPPATQTLDSSSDPTRPERPSSSGASPRFVERLTRGVSVGRYMILEFKWDAKADRKCALELADRKSVV